MISNAEYEQLHTLALSAGHDLAGILTSYENWCRAVDLTGNTGDQRLRYAINDAFGSEWAAVHDPKIRHGVMAQKARKTHEAGIYAGGIHIPRREAQQTESRSEPLMTYRDGRVIASNR